MFKLFTIISTCILFPLDLSSTAIRLFFINTNMPTSTEKSGKLGFRLDNMREQGSLSRVFSFVMSTKKIFQNCSLNYDYPLCCY